MRWDYIFLVNFNIIGFFQNLNIVLIKRILNEFTNHKVIV